MKDRYIEALNTVKTWYYNTAMSGNVKEKLRKVFPELEESEDERIRKALIEYFNEQCDMSDWNGVYGHQVVAWLKKQDKKVDVIENFDTEFEKQVSRLLASILRKDYEYTEGFVKWVSSNLLGYAKHEFEKQGGQKLAWSEEDENHVIGITQIIVCAIKRNVVSQKT